VKIFQGIPRYRYDELAAMPTISQGWDADLKYDDGVTRIWLQRTTPADGEPFKHTASVELHDRHGGGWRPVYQYDADHVSRIKEGITE